MVSAGRKEIYHLVAVLTTLNARWRIQIQAPSVSRTHSRELIPCAPQLLVKLESIVPLSRASLRTQLLLARRLPRFCVKWTDTTLFCFRARVPLSLSLDHSITVGRPFQQWRPTIPPSRSPSGETLLNNSTFRTLHLPGESFQPCKTWQTLIVVPWNRSPN
jgi:hypothetical protein